PLLALFGLGLFTRVRVGGPAVPWICLGGAAASGWLDFHAARWLGGYRLGFELLLLNGALTAAGLALGARVRPPGAD
ncbi:MAG: sodium:solute symporter, partial [Verrucomicrobiota bacterium]